MEALQWHCPMLPDPALTLADFDYDLPPECIAQEPVRPRDAARMLHVSDSGLADRMVRDLPALLRPDDVLVANDTLVFPAQLQAMRGSARIGLTLDRPRPDGVWQALARNGRRLRVGDTLVIQRSPTLQARVADKAADGSIGLAFNLTGDDLMRTLWQAGALALPPYIRRPAGPLPSDATDYQTVFARREGAVAAPTAGLHFTPELLAGLEAAEVRRVSVTLHVGIGTFLPVRVERVTDHRMHPERGKSRRGRPSSSTRRASVAAAWSLSAPPVCGCWKLPPCRMARSSRSSARHRFSSCRVIGSSWWIDW